MVTDIVPPRVATPPSEERGINMKKNTKLQTRTFRLDPADLATLAVIAERYETTVTHTARTLLELSLEAIRAHLDAEKEKTAA